MFDLKITSGFSSAHALRGYQGKCENIHGHNWKVEAVVSASKLNEIGIAIDFKLLKNYLNEVLETLDHKFINETPFFLNANPSAENLAMYIYNEFEKKIKSTQHNGIAVKSVNVYETDTSMASYYKID
ncbi:MAG: 6-carboxytetrahydropterin synthase QueD [Deltaproteobacteria bacterium]|jgi:6-pyruvoyltetrahydropterin/6-carboxytetrahydropterin synthase|uniref:6-carboxy-5,6,7,8-tetrahydropterin synthase n=1 Tax=Candidatus Acidulodesulfobacterium acidiphilum TaxID=2597224 RepID=A0A520XF58_9DELT|nr:6-carboxytetrahydropterin synthase QueD [Deltaproteobacteria bacterium]MDA8298694.1 6-carboxytetrahydropterin synthase QueD [Deltaproteobacteria bacterium]RZV39796.1 MAG: 6-carboxytetrahydropterin synthase QueD [Candidatus Acidulodesulfobacterium acidiphilum]